MIERRKEIRYTIPEIYQTLMNLKIRADQGQFFPATLLNVSLRGIKMRSPSKWDKGSVIECLISTPNSPAEAVPFYAEIHYCLEDKLERTFVTGAEIVQTSAKLWVNAFFRIHEFIDESLRMQIQKNSSFS